MKDCITLAWYLKIIFVKIYFTFKNNKMADTKKTQPSNGKSAKSSKEEASKGNSSKSMSNNRDSKDDGKADKKSSSSHSK